MRSPSVFAELDARWRVHVLTEERNQVSLVQRDHMIQQLAAGSDPAFRRAILLRSSVPNFLFHNQGSGTFEEIGLEAGVAYSSLRKDHARTCGRTSHSRRSSLR